MADDTSVWLVLREATEYLSKLGSNLRTRSENLKEKRILRDKLKNSHAAKKAADKVLLICELSKKSLENVESGVTRVLSVLHAAQSSASGGKTPAPRKSSDQKTNYHYFEYESYKLRISKKIPLKHFMSVKVLTRSMSISMQDKYPVYHDCKLYRIRNKGQKAVKKKCTNEQISTSDQKLDSEQNKLDIHHSDSDNFNHPEGVTSNSSINCINNENRKDKLKSTDENINVPEKNLPALCSKTEEPMNHFEKSVSTNGTKLKEITSLSPNNDSDNVTCADITSPLEIITDKNVSKINNNEKSKPNSNKVCEKRKQSSEGDFINNLDTDIQLSEGISSRKDSSAMISEELVSNNDKECINDVTNDNVSESDVERIRKHSRKSRNKKKYVLSDDSEDVSTMTVTSNSEVMTNQKDQDLSKSNIKKSVKRKRLLLTDESDNDEIITNSDVVTQTKPTTSANLESEKESTSKELPRCSSKEANASSKHSDEIKSNSANEDVVITLDDSVINLDDSDSDTKETSSTKKRKHKKVKFNESDTDSKKNKNSGSEDSDSNIDKVDTGKPLIKCVSISKLLKPDILNKFANISSKKEIIKKKVSHKQYAKHNKSEKSLKKSHKKEIEEEYWSQKREEVKNFKEKDFFIKLIRLPNISVDFLLAHNLRKIIRNDLVICEVPDERNDLAKELSPIYKNSSTAESCSGISNMRKPLLNDSREKSKSIKNQNDERTEKDETEAVKNALLNESDSNDDENCNKSDNKEENSEKTHCKTKSPEKTIDDVQKYKTALLFTSDSEKEFEGFDKSAANDNFKQTLKDNSLLNDKNTQDNEQSKDNDNAVSPDKNERESEKQMSPKDSEEIKTALLNSSESTQFSPHKKKEDKSVTPRSKRKHIMESMHAKKMLLTYSSSSETEDEELRGVLKEIKDSLLKGVASSDDEKNKKNECQRKLNSSSGSEDKEKQGKLSPAQQSTGSKNNSDNESRKSRDEDEQSNSSSSKIGRSMAKTGGSEENSDTKIDKELDGLTNLSNLNKKRRRRGSTSKSTRSRRKMSKSPLINPENMLQTESSSDVGSGAESECGEDLPTITLSGLNGDSIGHIAKDDLLGESDSSSSNVDKENEPEDVKKEDSEEEHVKLKRRKPNAISSDSENGSTRKKNKDVKMSDFEDSEEESSEPAKKSNKKKKGTDSDASVDHSSDDGNKKKRRRIKQVDSEESGSDTENEGRNKHGRKNIRKVMGKNQLEEATKKAAREEKERIARIAERQKLYNNLEFDESGKPDEVVLEKVVLDFDPETKEPLIEVDRGLVKKLKPHQANGIKFMWNACFESVKRIKKDRGSGCILAHCMGLGKTLQVVSLTHTLLAAADLTGVNRVLVVCPLSTVLNWVNEFRIWLKHAHAARDLDVYELSRHKQNSERAYQMQQWFESGGVCVLGYEMFRNLSADNAKKFKKKMLRIFQESLVDPGPDLVVCDEGHLLKNEKTSLSQSMNRVKTRRRIVLTGTPLQNNLKEYYCMVQFVKPNLLGKYNEYLNRFVNPITNGQYTDSTEHDIRVMKRRSHVLHKMLDGAVQRRDYGVLAPFLPPKHEYVLFITLTDVQIKLYQHYLDNYSRRPLPGKSSGFLFPDFQSLQRIWTHPLVLKYNSERYEIMQQKKREREEEDSEGSLADFIDDDSTPEESTTEESTDDSSDMSDDSHKKNKKKKSGKKTKKEQKGTARRGTRANPVEIEDDDIPEVMEVKNENPTEWWIKLVSDDELEDMRNSHKLVLLFDILRQCETIGDKLLVFSQSLYSLDLIEHFLGKVDEATQEGRIDEKLGSHVGSWSPGVDYFRLDGSTSCENRSIWCKNFNREDNPRARLFLISTRAGGLGINLVAANRVVIFDVSWNPSHDVQSIFRVYRFGQKKPCYIYRFLAMGTMEEKIYERQVTKQAISKRVIDEQQIDRHYAENDLAELYKFEPTPPSPRQLPPLPKDRLFAEMLKEHEAQIYKYHEHDSLLENKEEETLSEEERKAAWEDFENEKNRPPPAPFPSAWPMHNGMVPGLLAQQQQQLAYAALAAMLRKDIPNINDNQIRDMLPLIYNSNPQLMQKMSEMYKYTQPGMMNPAMMNAVMNPSGGGGGGMGGTSSLQYEPPWQRQQQQQHQMRLQQLLQQQQNMGAKYYAGGLGSRDPVAMALQQQRAREIMVGERGAAPAPAPAPGAGAGRPRGRPPHHPRPTPAAAPAPADVVNLDSD
ncbi:transcriptional regulator ATRX homolog [Achroia grisella]|uniref:transcriptional regulator ATRX homolog n=1 Tax=Achroia grisella TaxID=688607 RepID=UPI0027D21B76|nr:transcriptional regulator ATRX homolog [Achroia grisella]